MRSSFPVPRQNSLRVQITLLPIPLRLAREKIVGFVGWLLGGRQKVIVQRKVANESATAARQAHSSCQCSMRLMTNRGESSISEFVSMVQSTELRHGHHFCIQSSVLFPRTPARCLLRQPEMRSVVVVVADVFAHQTLQVPLVEHDHVVPRQNDIRAKLVCFQ